jgi:4,5-DOPA dioxygenase extradiol
MKRTEFLHLFGGAMAAMTLNDLMSGLDRPANGKPMPVMFVGHGSPMNAIEDNEFSRVWKSMGKELPVPAAILCISAHWQTRGTKVTMNEKPETIHDFGGFPKALFDAQYPAPGAVEMAKATIAGVPGSVIHGDLEWGLDHGTWSVLKPMFPAANIPVYQMSLDYNLQPQQHYQLATQLAFLRKKGVLIIGSGNIVHNLGLINWGGKAFDWAIEFDALVKNKLEKFEHNDLIHYEKLGKAAQLSIPTNEHYLPMLYIAALAGKQEPFRFFNAKTEMGSISMRSFVVG